MPRDRISELDEIVAQYNLNSHPFYQDWRNGTLPVCKLQSYAAQYALFIDTIDEGWDTIGETRYAEEERVHEKLWADFRKEVGATEGPVLPSTEALTVLARRSFRSIPEAIGALYSFEAQQPGTARSKLAGLEEHYVIAEKGREYFRVHADDFAEAKSLEQRAEKLSDADFEAAKSACAMVCAAMWRALDGIYETAA